MIRAHTCIDVGNDHTARARCSSPGIGRVQRSRRRSADRLQVPLLVVQRIVWRDGLDIAALIHHGVLHLRVRAQLREHLIGSCALRRANLKNVYARRDRPLLLEPDSSSAGKRLDASILCENVGGLPQFDDETRLFDNALLRSSRHAVAHAIEFRGAIRGAGRGCDRK